MRQRDQYRSASLLAAAALCFCASGQTIAATWQLTPTADAYVTNEYPSSNFGDDKQLFVHAGSNTKRTYLRYDLPALAAGEAITGATLHLFFAQGGNDGTTINLHHVADDSWLENAINWSNKPAHSATALDTRTALLGHAEMVFGVDRSLFASDQTGGLSLLLKLADEGSSDTATFYSKEAVNFPGNPGLPPQLFVTIAPVPEPGAWTLFGIGLGLMGWAARATGRWGSGLAVKQTMRACKT